MDWIDAAWKGAPIIVSGLAAYWAYRSQKAAWATSDRAERAETRAAKEEESRRRVGVRLAAVQDIPHGGGLRAERHAKVFLIPPLNGDYCEITHVKVDMPRGKEFEIRYNSSKVSGKLGTVVRLSPRIDLTSAEQQLNLSIQLFEFNTIGTSITFYGVRQDASRSAIEFEATIPRYGESGSITIFD